MAEGNGPQEPPAREHPVRPCGDNRALHAPGKAVKILDLPNALSILCP